jgi:hypothetical protein
MPKQQERKFGAIDDWAKTGPHDARNYSQRAEAHCAQRSAAREGAHPTIKPESKEFAAWQEYFDRHLGGRPKAFAMLLDGSMREMTVPEPIPQWFDPSFTPLAGWAPAKKPAEGTRPTLAQLKAKYGETWGIGVQRMQQAAADPVIARQTEERRQRAIEADYAAHGEQPVRSGGVLLSRALVQDIRDHEAAK